MSMSFSPASDRFLSRDECLDLLKRANGFARGGGITSLSIESSWTGNLRWARNQISTSGDVRTNDVWLTREIRGAKSEVIVNQICDVGIEAAVRRAERLLLMQDESYMDISDAIPGGQHLEPDIWSETTYRLDAARRAEEMARLVQPAVAAGMVSAGYLQVAAHGRTVLSTNGTTLYYPYTTAQYSVTVRDPSGTGSGWAGVDWYDWDRIEGKQLSAMAVKKCLASRNPVAIEPGRYVAILEPQAVADLCNAMIIGNREEAEEGNGPYAASNNMSRIGQQMIDERITITADPMDPDLGFPPFDRWGNIYRPAVWFEHGVLKNLWYDRAYAVRKLGINQELPNSGAYRMSGGTTSVEEMIATTRRGILVTRFSHLRVVSKNSLLSIAYTRDGTWLIEAGKIKHPVKNFRIAESPLFILNQVEQLGVPQRVFHPQAPVIVPPLKVKDFNFAGLADAV